eukprot:46787_1
MTDDILGVYKNIFNSNREMIPTGKDVSQSKIIKQRIQEKRFWVTACSAQHQNQYKKIDVVFSTFYEILTAHNENIVYYEYYSLKKSLETAEEKKNKELLRQYLKDLNASAISRYYSNIESIYHDRYGELVTFYTMIFCRAIKKIYQFSSDSSRGDASTISSKKVQEIEAWLTDRKMMQLKVTSVNKFRASRLKSIFHTDLYQKLQVNVIKTQFIKLAIATVKEKLKLNRTKFIESQPKIRSQPFIEKSQAKIKMLSVKQMKALWYQGINIDHNINPNQPILQDHVLAAVLYTDFDELCTTFRETYRKINKNESIDSQKQRHSEFANFGRLLYESFVFYGSTD